MSAFVNAEAAPDALAGFPSLAALKAAHLQLLKQRQLAGNTPEVLRAIATFIQRGSATGVVLEADDERWASQSVLDYWANVLFRIEYEPLDATLAEFDLAFAPELEDSRCPYLGLDAFQESERHLFFGRQRLVKELLAQVARARMLAIVGPSGSGKSSLMRAGLLPALHAGGLPGSEAWHYLPPIVPGSEPLLSLARLLRPLEAQDDGWFDLQVQNLLQYPGYLAHMISTSFTAPVVLTVDQFEEIFTLCDDDQVRRSFIVNLLVLTRAARARHTLILTMRSDFETFVARLPAFQALFEQAQVRVTPLNAGELREAIEGPAALVGLKFEAEVVEALLQDTLGEPAALPLLQFTLLKLWEYRERTWVTWESYRRLGGGRQVLARSADAFYEGLIPEEQITTRRILLRMVRPGEGLEVTSSRIRRDLLYRSGEARERIDRVLDKLIQARLVRLTGGDTAVDAQVEVAHEALVRNWPRLVGWLEEERAVITERRRLEAKAAEWVRLGRGSSGLLDEVPLREAERWLASTDAADLGYDESLAALVRTSRAALEEARQTEAARQVELARAQALAEGERQRAEAEHLRAEAQARSTRRTRQFAVVLLALLVLTVAAMVFALAQTQLARQNAELARRNAGEAQSLALVSGAQARLNQDSTDQALALALRANELPDAVPQVQPILSEAAYKPGTRFRFTAHTATVNGVRISPDGRTAASASADKTLILWDLTSGVEIRRFAGHALQDVEYSPDGQRLLVASDDHSVILWDVERGTELRTLSGHTKAVHAVAFSPDGHTALSGSSDTLIILWDLERGAEIRRFTGHKEIVREVAFSSDGRSFISASDDQTLILWDIASGKEIRRFEGNTAGVWDVAFSPDGLWLLSSANDGRIILWDVATGQPVREFAGHGDGVYGIAWAPDGRTFASGGEDASVMVWNPEQSQPIHRFVGHGAAVREVSFDPAGRTIISGSSDTTVRVWDLVDGAQLQSFAGHTRGVLGEALSPDGRFMLSSDAGEQVILWDLASGKEVRRLVGHEGPVNAVVFSPDGGMAISAGGSGDKTLILWDLTSGAAIRRFAGHKEDVYSVAFSPDGRMVLSGSKDTRVILWDVADGTIIREFVGHTDRVFSVEFSLDGRTALSGARDNTVILWDVASGQVLRRFEGHEADVRAVAFSPDGQKVLSGSEDKTLILWDLARGIMLGRFQEHTSAVRAITFSPDGRTALSGSKDNTIILWDLVSGQALRRYIGHSGPVNAVTFAADGRSFLSASSDLSVRQWRVDTLDELVAWIRAHRYVPELSCEQRVLYRLAPLCDQRSNSPSP